MKKLLLIPLFAICYLLFAVPTVHAEQCYVCRDNGKWDLLSGDGHCPDDKKDIECKKDEDGTFDGCADGEAVVGETCKSTQEDKLGVGSGQSLFSPENAAKLIPYGETGINVSDEGKSAEFFEGSSKAFGDTSVDPKCKAANTSNPFLSLINFFGELLARLFKGGIGTFQTIYTDPSKAPTACEGKNTSEEFNRGTKEFKDTLEPYQAP